MGSGIIKYNKLVRDKIPEIIEQSGIKPVVHIADDAELWLKLGEKLLEEVKEFVAAKPEEQINELADISEVIDTIMRFKGWSLFKLNLVKDKKRQEKGGFRKRIVLEEAWFRKRIVLEEA